MKGHRSGDSFYYAMMKRTDAIEVCVSLGLLEGAADHACCDNYSSVNPSWKKPLLSGVLVLVW